LLLNSYIRFFLSRAARRLFTPLLFIFFFVTCLCLARNLGLWGSPLVLFLLRLCARRFPPDSPLPSLSRHLFESSKTLEKEPSTRLPGTPPVARHLRATRSPLLLGPFCVHFPFLYGRGDVTKTFARTCEELRFDDVSLGWVALGVSPGEVFLMRFVPFFDSSQVLCSALLWAGLDCGFYSFSRAFPAWCAPSRISLSFFLFPQGTPTRSPFSSLTSLADCVLVASVGRLPFCLGPSRFSPAFFLPRSARHRCSLFTDGSSYVREVFNG